MRRSWAQAITKSTSSKIPTAASGRVGTLWLQVEPSPSRRFDYDAPAMWTGNRGQLGLLLAGLVAATFYYVPAFFFTQDDFGWMLLARDEWVRPAAVFTHHHGSFTPMSNAVFRALYAIGGLRGWPYYLLNLSLHLAASLLVLRLGREVLPGRLSALAAAAFFATTFSHWEAVMWLAGGLPQVLATCWVLISVLTFGAHLRSGRASWLVVSTLAFIFGLLTKESAVTTPVLAALYAALVVAPKRGTPPLTDGAARGGARRAAVSLIPIVVVGALYLAFQVGGFRFTRLIEDGLYPAGIGGHVVDNLVRYLFSLIAPDPRAPIVAGHLESLSLPLTSLLRATAEVSVWVLPVGIVALLGRGGNPVRFATLWILISLLPFLPIQLTPAARYLYLPSVSAALLFGLLVGQVRRRWSTRLAVALLFAVLAVNWAANRLAGETRLRNSTARRALIASVLEALESQPAAAVYLVDVPEKHADLCDGVRLLARLDVPCALRDAEEVGADGDEGTLVWVYRAAEEGP